MEEWPCAPRERLAELRSQARAKYEEGRQRPLHIAGSDIDPEAVDPEDVEMLQDMIVAAVNEGIANAQAMVDERMASVTGGMNIPGLF